MVHVFLLHPHAQTKTARQLAERLERGAEARVTLMETGDESVAELWDAGLDADGMVLLLSPESVPREKGRGPWESLLSHVERSATPPVSFVEMAPCAYPGILKRRDFHAWTAETPRALERWALSLHPALRPSPFVPAALPWFRSELDRLWKALVDRCGALRLAEEEATWLAQAFAHEARGHFREIVWVACQGREEQFVRGELGWRLNSSDVGETLGAHRILVVLDGWSGDLPALAPEGGRSSVLVTTGASRPAMPAGVTSPLWDAISACRPDRIPIDLAAKLAGVTPDAASDLEKAGFIVALDEDRRWYRRRAAATPSEDGRRRHTALLREAFAGPTYNVESCREWLAEAEATTDMVLGRRVFKFLRGELRYEEAASFCSRLHDEAWEQGDQESADFFEEELRWMHEGAQIRRPWKAEEQLTLF